MDYRECYIPIPNKTKKEVKEQYENLLKSGLSKDNAILKMCQINDLYFDQDMVKNRNDISSYIKCLVAFKQCAGKKFKDSNIKLGIFDESDENLDILSEFKREQVLLLKKIRKAREEENIGTYKNLIQAFKEITFLVQNEERKLEKEKMHTSVDVEYGRPN